MKIWILISLFLFVTQSVNCEEEQCDADSCVKNAEDEEAEAITESVTETEPEIKESENESTEEPLEAEEKKEKIRMTTHPMWINVMKFSPQNELIIADGKSGKIYVYQETKGLAMGPDEALVTEASFNLPDLDFRIKAALGVMPECIVAVAGLAVSPVDQKAYVAVNMILCDHMVPAVLMFTPGFTDPPERFDLFSEHSIFTVNDAPDQSVRILDKFPLREMTFTDLQAFGDKLYVSGLSDRENSSTIRIIDYPFTEDSKMIVAPIKIFHPSHDQNETRAPIKSFKIGGIEGKQFIFAIYTGTPLVAIPMDELKDGEEVFGKTIAQLGYGNTPINLLTFLMRMPGDKRVQEIVLITNTHQSAIILEVAEIIQHSLKEGITKATSYQYEGVPSQRVPIANCLHIADQDGKRLLAVRRDLYTGRLEMVSFIKGPYMRHGDFAKEHEFKGYKYPKYLEPAKTGHTMMKIEEGLITPIKEDPTKKKDEL